MQIIIVAKLRPRFKLCLPNVVAIINWNYINAKTLCSDTKALIMG